jgi:hypothetical protein
MCNHPPEHLQPNVMAWALDFDVASLVHQGVARTSLPYANAANWYVPSFVVLSQKG